VCTKEIWGSPGKKIWGERITIHPKDKAGRGSPYRTKQNRGKGKTKNNAKLIVMWGVYYYRKQSEKRNQAEARCEDGGRCNGRSFW